MAIKKALVADSGIVSQGPITANSTVLINGATTANTISAVSETLTGNSTAANYAASGNVSAATVVATTANVTTLNVGPGSVVANTTGVFVANVNTTTVNATAVNTTTVTSTGLANVASANVVGNLNVGGDINVTGNATVTGTLTIQGGTTTINSSQLNVADNLITLNSDVTSVTAPTENAGIEINRGSSANTGVRWNETSDYWEAGDASGVYARLRLVGTDIVLGTETSGNYVATVTGSGNGLTVSGAAGEGTAVSVSVAAANTTAVGTVRLLDSVISTSTTLAAVPNSVKTAYDAAISANTLAAGKVSSVGGTAGRITSTGGTAPVLDLATTGVTAGTFTKLTVDAYGRVTANANATTTDIAEGTNLYFTNARARSAMASGVGISFDAPSGTITNTDKGSDQLFFKSIADAVGTVQFAATTNQDTIRFAGGLGITATLNATAKMISFDSTGVTSFNTRTGAVTLTSADVTGVVGTIVNSFNTRTGAVTLTSSDVTGALGYTPADAATAGGTNASALSTGTVPSGRISGAYTGITGVGTLTSLSVNGICDVNQYTVDAGTAAAPSFTFNVDNDTGMYRIGVNRLGFAVAGASKMEINATATSVTGNFTATGTGTFSSDIRMKKDIEPIDSGQGVNIIMALEPVKFTRLSDGSRSAGYIAQQFREVAPEQVREDGLGMLSIDQIDASPYQTAAIQWLVSRVRYLEERLSRLEGN